MSIVGDKSKVFALRIVKLYKYLCDEKREYVMSKQVLRSGTSIGANLAEAEYAISRADFLSKTYIALKETAETLYWLELLCASEYLSREQYSDIREDADELRKLLSAITKSIRESSTH